MKNYIFGLMIFLSIAGCAGKHSVIQTKLNEEEISEFYSIVYVRGQECTGCADVYIDSGNLVMPPEFKAIFYGKRIDFRQLKLTGSFDFDLLDHNRIFYDNRIKGFALKGRVIDVDTSGLYEASISIFKVEKYEVLR